MTALTLPAPPTANQRFKASFGPTLALSLVAATVFHALLFDLWPSMEVAVSVDQAAPPPSVVPIDDTPLPPAPRALPRPALPEISSSVPADVTWDPPTWDEVPALAPPPANPGKDKATGSDAWFGPVTVNPSLINPDELRRALEREYPSILRDAGIGGTVGLLVRIDTRGGVVEAKVDRSSGYAGLDEAALKVAPGLRFRPALNRETPVSVWISLPVTFKVHGGGKA
jgi:protein TonB